VYVSAYVRAWMCECVGRVCNVHICMCEHVCVQVYYMNTCMCMCVCTCVWVGVRERRNVCVSVC
jgi:hypothetical protein